MSDSVELPELPGYISVKEAARLLGLAERTVYEYVDEGRIKAVKASGVILVSIEAVESFKPNPAGRPRTSIPQWRISPTDNSLLYTAISVRIREGKQEAFKRRLDEIRGGKGHLLPGTIARYVLMSGRDAGRVEIMLIWRVSVMPAEEARQLALEDFKQALADVLDWDSADYDDGSVAMHA